MTKPTDIDFEVEIITYYLKLVQLMSDYEERGKPVFGNRGDDPNKTTLEYDEELLAGKPLEVPKVDQMLEKLEGLPKRATELNDRMKMAIRYRIERKKILRF